MKKVLLLTVVMVLVAGMAYGATVVGTPHDLRSAAGLTTSAEVCVFCHTPHGASTQSGNVALWNHATSGATYTLYSNPTTIKGTVAPPGGVTKACLSCHDGTVAANQLQGGLLGTTAVNVSGAALIGTNLQTHHPVSITYRNDLNTGLKAPQTGALPVGNTSLPLFGSGTLSVECASCHAVHDNTTATPFLRAANTGSQLCTACHLR
jgi:predicted CXXCH cytochrome family protein